MSCLSEKIMKHLKFTGTYIHPPLPNRIHNINILEFPPCKRTITFNGRKIFTEFSFYQIFIIMSINNSLNNFYLFGTNNPLSSKEDDLYPIDYPHVNTNGSICQRNIPDGYGSDLPIKNKIQKALNEFWLGNNTYYIGDRSKNFVKPKIISNNCKIKLNYFVYKELYESIINIK